MSTASTGEQYMAQHDLRHEVLSHPHSHSSIETAEVAVAVDPRRRRTRRR